MIKIYLTNSREDNKGKWLDLPVRDEVIQEALKEIGVNEENENKYFISDFECEFPWISIDKNSSIDNLNIIADQLLDMDEEEIKICSTIIKNENCTLDEAIEQKDNRQVIILNNNFKSVEANLADSYIEQNYKSIAELDEDIIRRYFDFEGFGKDLKMNFNIDDDETIAVSNV